MPENDNRCFFVFGKEVPAAPIAPGLYLVATPIGVLAAYGLHASQVPFVRVAFVLLITPMMVPVVLVAIGAFYAYVKLNILYTMPGLVLAHSLLAIPLVVADVPSRRVPV